jgi:two-component system sensor histidine kinase DesK
MLTREQTTGPMSISQPSMKGARAAPREEGLPREGRPGGASEPPAPRRRASLAVFRAAAIAAWGIIGGQMILAPNAQLYRALLGGPAIIALHVAFGAAFWVNTSRIQGPPPTRASISLLALQLGIALLASPDLLLLVALEVPLVLPGRASLRWMAVQVPASVARPLAAAAGYGVFVPVPALLHLPYGGAVVLSILHITVWEWLAFAGGYLAATQYRAGQELARANAELLATRHLLADNSRLAERLRISRELHDAVGHHLAGLSVNLELARLHVDGQAAEAVSEAQGVAKALLSDVREMVSRLRRDRPLDLCRALEMLAAGTSDPEIHLVMPETLEFSNPAHAHAIFRCVQEAITNAVRHASARHLWIEVSRGPERVEVRVRDDGRGAADPTPGNGITGMSERFEDAGGGLEVESAPGGGFELRAWLPVGGETA